MANDSVFFDAIVARRAVLLDEEEALLGGTTVSLETQDMAESSVLTYVEGHFPEFLANLRHLSKEDQELLLAYYVLAKTQTSLAQLHKSTQTLCSSRIRLAMRKIGTVMILGRPTAAKMAEPLKRLGLENLLDIALSEVIELYAQTRSFQRVAELKNLHRPAVRRAMSQAAKDLSASPITEDQAIGAWITDLIDKASASGQGLSRRKLAKQGDMFIKTPSILGEFTIPLDHPDVGSIFVSRANR